MDATEIVKGGEVVSGAVGGAVLLTDLAKKILGPTADYLGEGLKGLTKKGCENINRIFVSAEKKLGSRINLPGGVSPRVLKTILVEGYFNDSELAAEYFGGILACSRTADSRDDRGAYLAGLVGRMSSYQIRAHYVLYQCFKHVFNGLRLPFNHMELNEKAAVCVPLKNYAQAMGCAPAEGLTPYLEHAVVGLLKESLISPYFAHGSSSFFRVQPLSGLEKGGFLGLLAAPSRLGLELFLWSHGEGWQGIHQVFFADNQFPLVADVVLDFTDIEKAPVAKQWGSEDKPASI
jgi:hypothetical protein